MRVGLGGGLLAIRWTRYGGGYGHGIRFAVSLVVQQQRFRQREALLVGAVLMRRHGAVAMIRLPVGRPAVATAAGYVVGRYIRRMHQLPLR